MVTCKQYLRWKKILKGNPKLYHFFVCPKSQNHYHLQKLFQVFEIFITIQTVIGFKVPQKKKANDMFSKYLLILLTRFYTYLISEIYFYTDFLDLNLLNIFYVSNSLTSYNNQGLVKSMKIIYFLDNL
jgi:hypothetical protein